MLEEISILYIKQDIPVEGNTLDINFLNLYKTKQYPFVARYVERDPEKITLDSRSGLYKNINIDYLGWYYPSGNEFNKSKFALYSDKDLDLVVNNKLTTSFKPTITHKSGIMILDKRCFAVSCGISDAKNQLFKRHLFCVNRKVGLSHPLATHSRSFSTSCSWLVNRQDNKLIINNMQNDKFIVNNENTYDSNYKLSLYVFTNIKIFLQDNPITNYTQLEMETFLLSQFKVWKSLSSPEKANKQLERDTSKF